MGLFRKRYPRYFRPRFDAWRTCKNNTDAQTESLIDQLPPLEGTMPPVSPQGVIYTSCNDPYLDLYVRDLIRSAAHRSPKQHFHLHLYDPSAEALKSLEEQISGGKLTVSWDHREKSKVSMALEGTFYFQNLRFVRMWQIAKACQSPIFLVDGDAVVRNDTTEAIAKQKDQDVALFLRVKRRNPLRRLLASAVIINPSDLGLNYARDCAAVFVPYILKGATEPIDQMLLHLVWRYHAKHVSGFRWANLDLPYSDWTYVDDSYVWHAKGSRKDAPIPLEKVFDETES